VPPSCPDPETLARFADGLASDDGKAALQAHIDGCDSCREVLVTLARESRPAAAFTARGAGPDIPPRGSAIGRYVVLEPRGAGGMGLVLAAYDDKLDRKVAIKLLRPDLEGGPEAQRSKVRLLREAQLMARVRHPNVVTVFDVGEVGDQIFIAMELVDGKTLREWLEDRQAAPGEGHGATHPPGGTRSPRDSSRSPREQSRGAAADPLRLPGQAASPSVPRLLSGRTGRGSSVAWREVLECFIRAGRGLVAAHAAGVVHRDFKPDNVLIDAAGEVHVSDFGLAWSAALPQPAAPTGPVPVGAVTRASAVIGTPAYMAPEQLRGESVDARSDQFAFCVALFEALNGQRPFPGRDTTALLAAINAGQRTPEKSGIPRAIHEAVRRGLSAKAADRHDSLAALLAELERARRRRWPIAAGIAAAALLAGVAFASRTDPCPPATAHLEGVWDAPRRAAIEQSFAAAPASLAAVLGAFDTFADGWTRAWQDTCAATRVAHTQSEEVMARRMVCLDGRLSELAALSELFAHADAAVVSNAVFAVERLQSLEPCSDGELLTLVELPANKEQRAEIATARLEIARSNALRKAGKHPEALAAANAAITHAKASRYRSAEAEALLALADEQRQTAKFKEAEVTLDEAQLAAEAGRDFESLAKICIAHIIVVGTHSMRPEEAEVWVKRAEGALEQMPRPALRAELDLALTVLRLAQMRPADSEAAARRAIEYFAAHKQQARTMDATGMLGEALAAKGEFPAAIAAERSAVDGRVSVLGADHPMTLRSRITLGEVLVKAGDFAEARKVLEAISEPVFQSLPPMSVAAAYCARGQARAQTGSAAGLDDLRSCVGWVTKAVGERHVYAGMAFDALAKGLRASGQLDAAVEAHAKAQAAFGDAKLVEAGNAAASFAQTLLKKGDVKGAQAQAAAALDLYDHMPAQLWADRCSALAMLEKPCATPSAPR
jgi:serine/threonine protein kinase/tetratricopeptide (TPR) repeat protein